MMKTLIQFIPFYIGIVVTSVCYIVRTICLLSYWLIGAPIHMLCCAFFKRMSYDEWCKSWSDLNDLEEES